LTQGEVVLEIAMPIAMGVELLICQRGVPAYLRSIIPIYRWRVPSPASQTPCETWLDDADEASRGLFARLRFRRLSSSNVGFWEPWRMAHLGVPVFVAGRIVELQNGQLEVRSGPRWFIPIVWAWSFLGPGPAFDTPTPVLLGVAVVVVGVLHYVRTGMIAGALRRSSESVRSRRTRG
jgi:hypothetical protein